MSLHAGTSEPIELAGTLRFVEIEGGFWILELDESQTDLGEQVVLQDWAPAVASGGDAPLADGSRVRACVHVRAPEDQFGFQMSGTMVDVLELVPEPAAG